MSEEKSRALELHRAESLISQHKAEIDDPVQISPTKTHLTYHYVASKTSTCLSVLGSMKVEVVMFVYMFSFIMRSVSSTTMIMDKVCLVHLGYPEDVCNDLKDNKDVKAEVEKLANNYQLGHQLIQMLPSSILSCFIGAWSDTYGRKFPIILALVGIIIDGLGSSICSAVFYSRVEFYYIPAMFTGFSGGFISVLTVLYSYAADTTTFGKRTMKYALMEMSFGLAMPLGALAGGWMFKALGYTPVFMASTAGHVFALVWVVFLLKETKGLDNKDSWAVKIENLFSCRHVIESFKATISPRPNKGREQILLLMLAMSFAVLSLASTAGISFLYVHHLYDWDNTKYSTISAVFAVIGLAVMMIAVPVFKRLKLGDATLGLVGSVSMMAKNIIIGLATTKELYIIAHFAGLIAGLTTLAGRSRISKVATKADIGKIFSFLTTAEAMLPIAATAVVSQVFNATLDIYPGIIYLVLGGTLIIPIAVFIWMLFLPTVNYEEMYNSPQIEENVDPPAAEDKKTDSVSI